jgi:hypothetical protein
MADDLDDEGHPTYKTTSHLPEAGGALRLVSFVRSQDYEQSDVLQCTVEVYSLSNQSLLYEDFSRSDATDNAATLTGQSLDYFPVGRWMWGDYIAMSHTWSTEEDTETIIVNGDPVQLSSTLVAGLRAISNLPGLVKGRHFKVWNDVLCLDQNNTDEIQRELKRVPSIYANAHAVVSWIGGPADNSHLVMGVLREKIADHALQAEYGTQDASAEGLLTSIDIEEWLALAKFLNRPYWRRQWVVQEVTLAGSRTVILCGCEAAPLRNLWELVRAIISNVPLCHYLFATALGNKSYYDPVRHHVFSIVARLLYLHDVSSTLNSVREGPAAFDLLALMDVCRGSLQKFARDKVYGILGILPPAVAALVEPDLSKPAHEVYSDLVVALYRVTRRLDILQNCRLDATKPVFPTWTPDLTVNSMAHTFGTRSICNAGLELELTSTLSSETKLLNCRGVLLDSISHLTPPQWPLQTPSDVDKHEASPTSPLPDIPYNEIRQALWHTLTAGSSGFPHSAATNPTYAALLDLPWPPAYDELSAVDIANDLIQKNWCNSDERQDMITFVMFRRVATRSFQLPGHNLGDFFPHEHPPYAETQIEHAIEHLQLGETQGEDDREISRWPNRKMLRQACNALKHRRLLVTRQGRIGICGPQTRAGDAVAVLRGCGTPLILRKRINEPTPAQEHASEAYMVVGAAYIHGIMGGEALSSSGPEHDILLC